MSHLEGLDDKLTKIFLKFIILDLLNEKAQQGFTIAIEIHDRYMILISPNMIYRLLGDMIDNELIENKGKDYCITERGRDALRSFINLTFEGEKLAEK